MWVFILYTDGVGDARKSSNILDARRNSETCGHRWSPVVTSEAGSGNTKSKGNEAKKIRKHQQSVYITEKTAAATSMS